MSSGRFVQIRRRKRSGSPSRPVSTLFSATPTSTADTQLPLFLQHLTLLFNVLVMCDSGGGAEHFRSTSHGGQAWVFPNRMTFPA
jgi:hypothetical protein